MDYADSEVEEGEAGEAPDDVAAAGDSLAAHALAEEATKAEQPNAEAAADAADAGEPGAEGAAQEHDDGAAAEQLQPGSFAEAGGENDPSSVRRSHLRCSPCRQVAWCLRTLVRAERRNT